MALPKGISEQMAKGQKDRSRTRDALLGFPVFEPTSEASANLEGHSFIPDEETTFHNIIDDSEPPEHKISHPKQQRTWEEENGFLESTTSLNSILR